MGWQIYLRKPIFFQLKAAYNDDDDEDGDNITDHLQS